jgi:hypothetical protein
MENNKEKNLLIGQINEIVIKLNKKQMNTSTNDIVKCVYCGNPMATRKYKNSNNEYFVCYKCKITIEVIKAIVDL